ncbi:MAG: penicillin-binding protein 2, partial [Candidatus Berkelbacteria bacterium]|nr:penicillin-binding protein 2 [Candidatus Berkelbacteria bacterium]
FKMDIFGNFSNLSGDKKKRRAQVANDSDFQYTDQVLEGQSKIDEHQQKGSFSLVKIFLIIIFLLLASRLFFLQVISASKNQSLALGNSIRPRSILSSRGVITDSNGIWLARNKPSFALGVYPSDIPKKSFDRQIFYQKLAEISGISADEIKTKIEANGLTSIELVVIKANLPRDEALILQEDVKGLPGVVVDARAVREYKSDFGLSHILGYTGLISDDELTNNPDYLRNEDTGKSGLEKIYQDELRGTPGVVQVEVDSHGTVIKTLNDITNRQPEMGDNLTLNIDCNLQQVMASELAKGIANSGTGSTSGTVIAMNPQTGAVLGMVSQPYYDGNIFEGQLNKDAYQKLLADPNFPLLNRATMGIYPSGSVIKIVMAAAGINEGVISPNTSIETPPAITIGDYNFPDWKYHTGMTDVERAIAESNDIFFYALAGGYDKIKGLGVDKIDKYLSLFGFGSKTGIDLPSEATGLVPTPAWKKQTRGEGWYIGDTYHLGIGQGDLLVTPLQMLGALSAISNGGNIITPQLVKEITNSDGKIIKTFIPQIRKQNIVSAASITTVQAGMRQAVTSSSGSGRLLQNLPVTSAAKTGTAQFMNNQKEHAWFEAYAPYDNPQIAIMVMIEGGGEGYTASEPVADDILQYYFSQPH